jgi:hypothetical protein
MRRQNAANGRCADHRETLEMDMKASVGDWIVIRPDQPGAHLRQGMVVESPQADGSPPWRVRWTDNDHETLLFPGPDARVVHEPLHASASR